MKRLALVAVVVLMVSMCMSAQAQWDTIGDHLLDLISDNYGDIGAFDVRASGAVAATGQAVPADIDAGGVPTMGLIGYQYNVTHTPELPATIATEQVVPSAAWSNLDGSSAFSANASAGTAGDVIQQNGLYVVTGAYSGSPYVMPPMYESASPNTYTWSEARTRLEEGYDDLPADVQSAVDDAIDDMLASPEYAEVGNYLVTGAGGAAARADHVYVQGPAGMVDVNVTIYVNGYLSVYANSSTGMSSGAVGFAFGVGAANASFKDGEYGAAGVWQHGTGLTDIGTAGLIQDSDLVDLGGGIYAIDKNYTITLSVPANPGVAWLGEYYDPFVIGFGLVGAAASGLATTESWGVASGYSGIIAQLVDISAPTGYVIHLVPEPGSLALLGLGVAGILIRRRKK